MAENGRVKMSLNGKSTLGRKPDRFKRITGTFIDGVATDIPSQNWGCKEWARQFDTFKDMGMDSVFIIRVGFNGMAMYDSRVRKADVFDIDDRVRLFLDEAGRCGLRLYMGLYDTGEFFPRQEWQKEAEINEAVIDELMKRYGHHPAFHGWYLSHEPPLSTQPWRIWNPLIAKLRSLTPDKPLVLSPRFEGRKWDPRGFLNPERYAERFDHVLAQMPERVDAAAFMDGHVDYGELSDYAAAMRPCLAKRGIEFWSNLEAFDRDMPFKFPTIDWLKMRVKLEAVQPHVTKIITFEAPHFLSPYSMWEPARMLFNRYMEYIGKHD